MQVPRRELPGREAGAAAVVVFFWCRPRRHRQVRVDVPLRVGVLRPAPAAGAPARAEVPPLQREGLRRTVRQAARIRLPTVEGGLHRRNQK